jgi:hypothetical protein
MKVQAPPDTRPGALLVSGLRRGTVLVFLPVFFAGQAIAWLTYAASGWYGPWSWLKIGIAEALASVRVAFDTTGETLEGEPSTATLQVALGALTILVLVLAYRAGREQAKGLESHPLRAELAGAAVGLGFAIPMLIVAFPVSLGFPRFGIDQMSPVLWQAFVFPLVVGAVAGAVGGLNASREALEGSSRGARLVAATRGGALAFWWGLLLAFAGFLLVAALEPGPTGAYARFVGRTGGTGAATIVQHALLLPNQSAMILATAMGAPTSLSVGGESAVKLTREGVVATSERGSLAAAVVGAEDTQTSFPSWFSVFLLVPLVSTIFGGRAAAEGVKGRGERARRGVLAGAVFALLCGVAAWAATIVVPAWSTLIGGSLSLGTSPTMTAAFALAWGVIGCLAGSMLPGRAGTRASAVR